MSRLEPGALRVPLQVFVNRDASLLAVERHGPVDVLVIAPGQERLAVALQTPVANSIGYWCPTVGARPLVPDWLGNDVVSAVSSSPMGCLYEPDGSSRFAFAFDDAVSAARLRFGVWQEHKDFVLLYERRGIGKPVRLAIAEPGGNLYDTLGVVRRWQTAGGAEPVPTPPGALVPTYCTWYARGQEIDERSVQRDAEAAAELGIESIFIDDGWQDLGVAGWYRGCGAWVPDAVKFPHLAAHVERLHELGHHAVLWVAPLLLGELSQAYPELQRFATVYEDRLRCWILDPRAPEVRAHVVATCLRLLEDYRIDGLKIDFLDEVRVYYDNHTSPTGDIPDAGRATVAMLSDLAAAMAERGMDDKIVEFRQPYVGPAAASFANALRAWDCPTDAVVNRRSIMESRMTTDRVVHSDPITWDPVGGTVAAARQLLSGFFAVPQISMPLADLPPDQTRVLRAILRFWRSCRDVVLRGKLKGGLPADAYPTVEAWDGEGRGVVGVYQSVVVPIRTRGIRDLTLLNASASDSVVVRWSGARRVGRITAHDVFGEVTRHEAIDLSPGLAEIHLPMGCVAVLSAEG